MHGKKLFPNKNIKAFLLFLYLLFTEKKGIGKWGFRGYFGNKK